MRGQVIEILAINLRHDLLSFPFLNIIFTYIQTSYNRGPIAL
jgi:hypothetical protein